LAASSRVPEALELLEQAASKGSPSEQIELAEARLKLLLATQQWDRAQELSTKLIAIYPNEPKLLTSGIDIALRRQDFKHAAKLVESLQSLPGADDFDRRLCKARLLVATFGEADAAERNEADSLIESLRSERPNWLPVMTLAGQLAEALGRRADAIGIYQSALKMGDRRSETTEHLARLLFAEGRFAEASEYLAQLKTEGGMPGKFESLAIAAAVKGNRLDEARALAEDAVKRGSRDPAHYIMLASIHHEDGNKELAESTLRTAVREFPKDGRVWNAVFLYFVQIGQQDRAKQALERWATQVPTQESEKLLILGQGSEALGDAAAAQDYYRQAVASNEDDIAARFLLAKLLASSDMPAATRELDALLAKSPNHAEARRLQASLLATTGDANDWAKALSLLESVEDRAGADPAVDERLRAVLLSRKGKDRRERITNYQAAREILAKRVKSSDEAFIDIDRMLLAGMCEQEANLTDDPKSKLPLILIARDTLRPVVDRSDASTEQLLSYIQFLLRHVADEAWSKTDEAEEISPRQVFVDDARAKINLLEQLLSRDSDSPDKLLLPVALRMKLLQAEGKPAEGVTQLDKFVESQIATARSDTEKGKLLLQAGKLCASVGEFSAAEEWFRRLERIAPQSYILVAQSLVEQQKPRDAVRLCLQVMGGKPTADGASVLAQILASEQVSSELERQALHAIDDALDADRGNLNLLMSSAVLRTTRNENDEAIRLFRRVVELQPRHALALNNLATLLSEQPDQLKEAQQFVERAIAISGRQPHLLDTLGTILLRSRQFRPAIAALEEAVAGSANDPRYYFHLAAAYDGNGQPALAQEKLKVALGLGLEKTILTSGDRELLVSLKKQALSQN
jgi:tetratricopeptide (TPR) repeat protein